MGNVGVRPSPQPTCSEESRRADQEVRRKLRPGVKRSRAFSPGCHIASSRIAGETPALPGGAARSEIVGQLWEWRCESGAAPTGYSRTVQRLAELKSACPLSIAASNAALFFSSMAVSMSSNQVWEARAGCWLIKCLVPVKIHPPT